MFERGSLTLLRVRGIPVRAHWTLLVVLPYVAYIFAVDFRLVAEAVGIPPDRVVLPPVVWGGLLALGLFASVALHELAHSLVAARAGAQVRDITLMLLGGVSHLEQMPRRPGTEALVAAVGPLTSLVLGGVLLAGYAFVPAGHAARLAFFYLGYLNVVLGVFNLVPAFPMDGGRVLRAALVPGLGRRRATDVAAGVGTGFAIVLALVGLWLGSFLMILVGGFILFAARAEARQERVRDTLRGLRTGDLLTAPPVTIALTAPLAEALPRMYRAGRLELIAVGPDGEPAGVVRAADVAGLPVERVATMDVRGLGDRLSARVAWLSWDTSAEEALDQMTGGSVDYLILTAPSVEGAVRPVGLLSARELETALAMRTMRREERRPATRPT